MFNEVSEAAFLLGFMERADTHEERIPTPSGYQRVPVSDGSFGAWLRRFPLLPAGTKVRLFDGRDKRFQDGVQAVLDLEVGRKDLA